MTALWNVFGRAYERGAPQLRAIRRGSEVHLRVAEDRDQLEASLSALADTALRRLDTTNRTAQSRALIDPQHLGGALHDQGLGPAVVQARGSRQEPFAPEPVRMVAQVVVMPVKSG